MMTPTSACLTFNASTLDGHGAFDGSPSMSAQNSVSFGIRCDQSLTSATLQVNGSFSHLIDRLASATSSRSRSKRHSQN